MKALGLVLLSLCLCLAGIAHGEVAKADTTNTDLHYFRPPRDPCFLCYSKCPDRHTRCGDQCFDLSCDWEHCGKCDRNVCISCTDRRLEYLSRTYLPAWSHSLTIGRYSCSQCPNYSECVGGRCKCADDRIPCRGKCVPNDRDNCGRCGNKASYTSSFESDSPSLT